MSPKIKNRHPEWAVKHKKPGTELRLIKSRYYLYEYKTVYDSVLKKPKKITGKSLGSITEKDGLKPSRSILEKRIQNSSRINIKSSSILVKEFGMSQLVLNKFTETQSQLKKQFGEKWVEVFAMAFVRLVYKCPLKAVSYHLERSLISEKLSIKPFNEKTASGVLNTIGGMQESMQNYMKSFIKKGDYILMDGTSILSKSKEISFAKPGYNSKRDFGGQINLMYIYSASQKMPVFYRLLSGNIKDVKAFKNTLALSGITNATIIADKGFYSKQNIEVLIKEKFKFIIPMKRDNIYIDYSSLKDNRFKSNDNYFNFEERVIWYKSYDLGDTILHQFLDDRLRTIEEKDYLDRITENSTKNTIEKYHERQSKFGTISMLTPKKMKDSIEVYESYKGRGAIETMFDGMKNILEADNTYMQNEQTLEGWMFVNHICLQWYQSIYIELKEKNILKKYSVSDYIRHLAGIYKVKIDNEWILSENTKSTLKLMESIGLAYNT